MTSEKLYTVQELAEWLRVSRDMIEKAIKNGKLVVRRPGGGRTIRIPESSVKNWMEPAT
jgi:excisionase family DNA binding protein